MEPRGFRLQTHENDEETLFRDVMVLDDLISEMGKELREAGKALRRVALE